MRRRLLVSIALLGFLSFATGLTLIAHLELVHAGEHHHDSGRCPVCVTILATLAVLAATLALLGLGRVRLTRLPERPASLCGRRFTPRLARAPPAA